MTKGDSPKLMLDASLESAAWSLDLVHFLGLVVDSSKFVYLFVSIYCAEDVLQNKVSRLKLMSKDSQTML